MGITPVDLYRRGNATSPRIDHIRSIDVGRFTLSGVEWVVGRSGGISTFASSPSPGRGKIWRLPAGVPYSDELVLINDHGNHWSWEPAQNMELTRYRELLAALGRSFA
jgi:hypothetical protein